MGAGVLSVIGILFVLVALVMLGIHYMNGMVKGMCLSRKNGADWKDTDIAASQTDNRKTSPISFSAKQYCQHGNQEQNAHRYPDIKIFKVQIIYHGGQIQAANGDSCDANGKLSLLFLQIPLRKKQYYD